MPREPGKHSSPGQSRSLYPSCRHPLYSGAVPATILAQHDAVWGGRQPPHLLGQPKVSVRNGGLFIAPSHTTCYSRAVPVYNADRNLFQRHPNRRSIP